MTNRQRRAVVGVVIPLALVLAAALAWTIGWSSLPDPVATHWRLSGRADGSTSRVAAAVLFTGLTAASAAWIAGLVARKPEPQRFELSIPAAIGTFLATLFAAISVLVVTANVDVARWQDADDRGWSVLVVLVVAAAGALVARRLAAPLERPSDAIAAVERPTLDASSTERLSWFANLHARWLLLGGLAFVAIGLAGVLTLHWLFGVLFLVVGLVGVSLASIGVTADHRGLIVSYGPWRWPRTHIGLDRIERASSIDVKPMSHGGWGYRGSMALFGKAAVVIRSGPGIQLDLTNGKSFVVTVDDADTGAAVLNDLGREPNRVGGDH